MEKKSNIGAERPYQATSAYESSTFKTSMTIRIARPAGSVGSMSISPCGRDVVLASRDGLHIVDLDNPYDPPKFLHHQTAWDVADVQWSPFAARDHWVVSTSNQKALVWNLNRPTNNAVEFVLHGHARAITDINFSAHNPDHLATCSVDSFVHVWDMKIQRKPVITFCDWFAGATQVKYNRQNEHILASSHDKLLHIWDKRKGAFPLRTINAHDTKIYGIDWNRTRPTGIVTCSLDKTVKFWDYETNDDQPERVIRTPYPVWRARHTPFGWGVLTMPQRGDDDLYLYDRRAKGDSYSDPVSRFSGHSGQVKEFLWRSRGGGDASRDDREFQLVTWSKDRDIRLWEISPSLMELVGHDPKSRLRFRITRFGAQYRTFRKEVASTPSTTDVQQPSEPSQHMTDNAALRLGLGKQLEQYLKMHPYQITPATLAPDQAAPLQASGGFMSLRVGGSQRSGLHRDMNPIQWMKGVRMKHAGEGVFRQGPQSGNLSPLLGGTKETPDSPLVGGAYGWGGPETLSDEITLVGLRFPKVKFERVNVAARSCQLSLTGPWGFDNKWVFVRCAILFPPDYPQPGAMPTFQLDKTMMIPEGVLAEMYSQLQKIAQSHVKHYRFCLESCMSYLLGERAEDAMFWDSRSGVTHEDSSSSDADDQVNEREEGDELRALVERNNKGSVPVPKACGAMWSETGRLVCFFPPKEENSRKSLLNASTPREDLSHFPFEYSSRRKFETFGRFGTTASIHSPLRGSEPVDSSSEFNQTLDKHEEFYTGQLSSSQSSSSSGENLLRPTFTWKLALTGQSRRHLRRNQSTDRSTQRSGTIGQLKSSANLGGLPNSTSTFVGGKHQVKNYVTIHDFSHLLAAKEDLAREYAIYGDGPEVCSHNSRVAEDYGLYDISNVWKLVETVLCNDVPLEVMSQPFQKDPVLVMARKQKSAASALSDGSETTEKRPSKDDLFGRVKWGTHPLGGQWFVQELMTYFESLADSQMLAMLSCVFLEPENKRGISAATLQLSQSEIPISMKSPAFSLDYLPSLTLKHSETLSASPQLVSIAPTPYATRHGSFSSTSGFITQAHLNDPYSLGGTPPLAFQYPRQHDELVQPSLSSSPEQVHGASNTPRRIIGISNLAGGFTRALNASSSGPAAGARSSHNYFASNTTSSPEKRLPRSSPIENFITPGGVPTLTPTVKFAEPANVNFSNRYDPESTFSERSQEDENELYKELPFSVRFVNMEQFDDEGSISVPFLDPSKAAMYKNYRDYYANLLYIWEQPLSRLEVLKFNALSSEKTDTTEVDDSFKKSKNEYWEGLGIAGSCSNCGTRLKKLKGKEDSGAKGECPYCERLQFTLNCCICNGVVRGLFTPCLNCGHISHARCHDEWFEDDSSECPTGCGCKCFLLANKGFKFDIAETFHDEMDDEDLVMLGYDDEEDRQLPKRPLRAGTKSVLNSYMKFPEGGVRL